MIQRIPASGDQVWELFSDAANLVKLTPPRMDIRIISAPDDRIIYPGQIIEYKLKPLWGVPVHWITEIRDVDPGRYFMDTQRKGPYRLWEHQHHFKPVDGGIEMTDIVNYQVPLGVIGRMANTILVRDRLKAIFAYRYEQVENLLGKWEGQQFIIEIS